jgi:hypothetical protein
MYLVFSKEKTRCLCLTGATDGWRWPRRRSSGRWVTREWHHAWPSCWSVRMRTCDSTRQMKAWPLCGEDSQWPCTPAWMKMVDREYRNWCIDHKELRSMRRANPWLGCLRRVTNGDHIIDDGTDGVDENYRWHIIEAVSGRASTTG